MVEYELVRRRRKDGSVAVFWRRKIPRKWEELPPDDRRRLHYLQWALVNRMNRGKSFEEVVENVRKHIKPVGRKEPKKRTIEIDKHNFYEQLIKYFNKVGRIEIPTKFAKQEIKIKGIEKLKELAKEKLKRLVFR